MMSKTNDASLEPEMHMTLTDGEEDANTDAGGADPDTRTSAKGKATRSRKTAGEQVKAGPESEKDAAAPLNGDEGSGPDNEKPGEGEDEADADPETVLRKELASERDKYLRLAAEYDNFRKRSIKERESTYGDARADAVTRLLPVYDNLERALKLECADEAFYKGVEMTMVGFGEILENMGVKLIEAVGEPFDPNRHNAVMSIENPELGEKIVSEEFIKGFTLGDRVIRCSTVVVAN